jgi:hypothetical protein
MSDLRQLTYTHRDVVRAPPSVTWAILMDSIRNPTKYIPGMSDVTLLNERERYIERKAKMGGVMACHDLISWDPNLMTIVHRDHAAHPESCGYVLTAVLPDPTQKYAYEFAGQDEATTEGDTCFLDFTLVMTAKAGMTKESFEECSEALPQMLLASHTNVRQQAESISQNSNKKVDSVAQDSQQAAAEQSVRG